MKIEILNDNIYEWAQRSGEYSKWIKQVDKSDENYKLFLQNSVLRVTAFIPTNEAFDKFYEPSNDIIGSHLVYGSFDLDKLLKIKNKSHIGVKRSMLRFSRGFDESRNRSAVFVLDARILESHQVGNSMVHIIDRVLNLPKSTESVVPNALEWIRNPNIYPSVSVASGVGTFSDFIERQNVTFQFSNCTECTFFVPENIDNKTAAKIDANVLLGHVIPNQILFLRSTNNSTPYKTKADSSNLTVELYKEERSESDSMESFVYLNTKGSISTHFGNTRVKITRANIPVNNGVIHIIEKPLINTDVSISHYLNAESETNEVHESVNIPIGEGEGLIKSHFIEQKTISTQSDGMFKETASLGPNIEPDFSVEDRLNDDCFTFFAPTEAAWNKLHERDPETYKKLINGSIVEGGKWILEQFLIKLAWPYDILASLPGISTETTLFEFLKGPQLTLKYINSTTTIVRPDITAINGYIHGIDTVITQDIRL
uniref:FAS1 domain-containing protein n=1 Tax=Tetranychus urticae TaxID=32264 RepID=T1KTC9_TETUR